jgi:hypothetical protein
VKYLTVSFSLSREHKARVSALVQQNSDFYRRQRCCECITMLTVLLCFTVFSLYIVFAYGFYIGQREPFNLVKDKWPSKVVKPEVRALCVK